MSDDTQTQVVSVPAKTRMLAAMMTGYIEATREAMAAVVKATWNPELRDEAHKIYSIFDDVYDEDGYKDTAQHQQEQQDHVTQQEQQDRASQQQQEQQDRATQQEQQDSAAQQRETDDDALKQQEAVAEEQDEEQDDAANGAADVQCEVQDDDAVARKGHGEFRALAFALASSIPRIIAVLNQFVRSSSFEPSNDAHIEARNLLDDLQGDALMLQGTSLFQVVLAPDPKADVTQ